jgi:prepilin-type N-terminal cleavage/methylation domain-containing protein
MMFRALGKDGFSLVEVSVAIGIFAFVVVGIFSMFPAGMRQQASSAQESLGVQTARHVMASIAAARHLSDVNLVVGRSGPTNVVFSNADLLAPEGVVLGLRSADPLPVRPLAVTAWTIPVVDPNIQSVVRIAAAQVAGSPNLYRVSIDLAHPVGTTNVAVRQVESFSTLVFKP